MPKKKVIVLVSGGIDSPVAAVMLGKKYEVLPLHFCHYPFYCKGSVERALKILGQLQSKIKSKRAVVVPWAPVLKAVLDSGYRDYMCVICRAAMFRAAGQLAKEEGAVAIATGEALAQKASQTLDNMAVTSSATDMPILRPLLGMDKPEIEELSKRFGLWTTEHVGCCSATPEKPKTKARPDKFAELWARLGIEGIVGDCVGRAIKIEPVRMTAHALLEKLG